MADNTKRSLFGLHGIFGVLISIVGLLTIAVILMTLSIISQREATTKPYDPSVIRDINNLKMIDVNNTNFAFQPKDK